MEKISYKFKRTQKENDTIPTMEQLENDLMLNLGKVLPKKLMANKEMYYWFGKFLSISAYSGLATEIDVEKEPKKPMTICGTGELVPDIFKAVVYDNGFALATNPIKNIEELHLDENGLMHMLDITPNAKERADDYDETMQYSISKRGEYSITVLEEIPHVMEKFPEANDFPTNTKIGGYMSFYLKSYLKEYPINKNPISTHASFSYTTSDKLDDNMKVMSLFDIVILGDLYVVKVNGEEYMRTKDFNEVKNATMYHPDIANALSENATAKAYLDKFIKSYENVKKTTFIINGMLG